MWSNFLFLTLPALLLAQTYPLSIKVVGVLGTPTSDLAPAIGTLNRSIQKITGLLYATTPASLITFPAGQCSNGNEPDVTAHLAIHVILWNSAAEDVKAATNVCDRAAGGRPRGAVVAINSARLSAFDDATALHELIHALGFNKQTLKDLGMVGTFSVSGAKGKTYRIGGVTTAGVLREASAHFGCPGLRYMPLEDDFASNLDRKTSNTYWEAHWKARVVFDEVMAARDDFVDRTKSKFPLSRITIAALEDTTWYARRADAVFDNFAFGRGRGCKLVKESCVKNLKDGYFFCTGDKTEVLGRKARRHCTLHDQKAACDMEEVKAETIRDLFRWFKTEGPHELMMIGRHSVLDKCPIPASTSTVSCRTKTKISSIWGEFYDKDNSLCVVGNIGCNNKNSKNQDCKTDSTPMKPGQKKAYCLEYRCNNGVLQITLNLESKSKKWVTCTTPGARVNGLSDASSFKSSYIICPDPQSYCPIRRQAALLASNMMEASLSAQCPCQNGGDCDDETGDCLCGDDYVGDQCEVPVSAIVRMEPGVPLRRSTNGVYFLGPSPADGDPLESGTRLNVTVRGGGPGAFVAAAFLPRLPSANVSEWSTRDAPGPLSILLDEIDLAALVFSVLGGDGTEWTVEAAIVAPASAPILEPLPPGVEGPCQCASGECRNETDGSFTCLLKNGVTSLQLTTETLSEAGQAFPLAAAAAKGQSFLVYLPGLKADADIQLSVANALDYLIAVSPSNTEDLPVEDDAVWEADENSGAVLIEAGNPLSPRDPVGLYISTTILDEKASALHLVVQLAAQDPAALQLSPAPARRPFLKTSRGKLAIALPIVAVLVLALVIMAIAAKKRAGQGERKATAGWGAGGKKKNEKEGNKVEKKKDEPPPQREMEILSL